MRTFAVALFAIAVIGPAAAQQQAPEAPRAAPQTDQAPAARGPGNPAPHQGNQLADPQHQRQGEQTVQSRSGQNGKEEPATKPPARDDGPVLVDGRLNVAGAPADGQTVPAKFSTRNDSIDKLPILAMPLGFSAEQERTIAEGVKAANAPVARIDAKVTQELPLSVELREWPDSVKQQVPGVAGLKYVRLSDRILLVRAPNMVVVGEIKG